MRNHTFSQIVGTGLVMVAIGGLGALEAIAHSRATLLSSSKSLHIGQLAQISEPQSELIDLPEGTLVFSQTENIAVRVYNDDRQLRLNWYNKQTGITELLGVPVTVELMDTEIIYRYAGRQRVEIAIAQSGEQTITMNGLLQPKAKTVTGTVSYLPRIALPPDAVVAVELVDIGRADTPEIILASTQITSRGQQIPFPFELPYDPAQIDPSLSYGLRASIVADDNLRFATTADFLTITYGTPTKVAIQVEQLEQAGAVDEETTLTSDIWQLQQILYNDGELVEPASPSDYTIEFMEDGQVTIQADCNRVSGSFTEEAGSGLSIELGPTTLAGCSPESIDRRYLQALQDGVIYFFQGGALFIDIKLDTGTMQFFPASISATE